MRHLAADGRPLTEAATLGAWHMLDVARGPTPETSPALGVEVRVVAGGVEVMHWIAGEPFRVVATAGRA